MSKAREPIAYRVTDEAYMKMPSVYHYPNSVVFGSLSSLSNIYPSDYFYVDMNNIYSPGVQNTITAFNMPIASGWTQQTAKYVNWKVRSCSVEVTITMDSGDTGGEQADLHFAIVPLSSALNAIGPVLLWDTWRLQPYFKEFHLGSALAGQKTVRKCKHFISIAKAQGVDAFNQRITNTVTAGAGSTPPTSKPTWWCMMFAPNATTASACRYSVEIKATYYVEWSLHLPIAPAFPADAEETKIRDDEKDAEDGDTPMLEAMAAASIEEKKDLPIPSPPISKGWFGG